MRAARVQGPAQMESTTLENAKTLYFAEVLSGKTINDTVPALSRMINKIQNNHRCRAAQEIHGERAAELTGDRVSKMLEDRGLMATSTTRGDSNANGGACCEVDKR